MQRYAGRTDNNLKTHPFVLKTRTNPLVLFETGTDGFAQCQSPGDIVLAILRPSKARK